MLSSLRAVFILALAMPAATQITCGIPGVTVTVSPSQAAPGQLISVNLSNNSTQTISLPTSCVIRAVHQKDCSGSVVFGPACLQVITPVPSGTSRIMTWDQTDNNGAQVPNGTYGIEIRYFDQLGTQTCCPTVSIGGCGFTPYGTGCPDFNGRTPTLMGTGCATPGSAFTLTARGGPPGAPAALAFGTGRGTIPIVPGCALAIAPFTGVVLPLMLSASGDVSVTGMLPAGAPPTTLTMQLATVDSRPGAPPLLVLSTALEMRTP